MWHFPLISGMEVLIITLSDHTEILHISMTRSSELSYYYYYYYNYCAGLCTDISAQKIQVGEEKNYISNLINVFEKYL